MLSTIHLILSMDPPFCCVYDLHVQVVVTPGLFCSYLNLIRIKWPVDFFTQDVTLFQNDIELYYFTECLTYSKSDKELCKCLCEILCPYWSGFFKFNKSNRWNHHVAKLMERKEFNPVLTMLTWSFVNTKKQIKFTTKWLDELAGQTGTSDEAFNWKTGNMHFPSMPWCQGFIKALYKANYNECFTFEEWWE